MFLDLQLRCRGMRRVLPFISTMLSSLISGHWRQPRPLQCWSSIVLGGKLKCLFWTTAFPIELLFFSAKRIRVSPISCWNSLWRLRTTDLKSMTPSKKWTGNTNVSPSMTSLLTASVLLSTSCFNSISFPWLYPLASKWEIHWFNSTSLALNYSLQFATFGS